MQTPVEASVNMVTSNATSSAAIDQFFDTLAAARDSALLLDFDGTIAPFRIDPANVRPWAGVAKLLNQIQLSGRTRIAIVSGRPARDVAARLGTASTPEIWGLHGAERLDPNGELEQQSLTIEEQTALDTARSAIKAELSGVRLEQKWNAVAAHWRGAPVRSRDTLRCRAAELLQPFAIAAGLRLLHFDGGIELRAGRDKGDAVRLILNQISSRSPVAYLGDDTTDEDAFLALGTRGLSALVRRQWRPSAAQIWLRPPAELRSFLTTWLQNVRH